MQNEVGVLGDDSRCGLLWPVDGFRASGIVAQMTATDTSGHAMRRILEGLLLLFAAVAGLRAPSPAQAPVLLEMRPVADSLDNAAAAAARKKLVAWLDRDQHRELVQRMPLTIHAHRDEIAGDNADARWSRWYPHVLRPRGELVWTHSFTRTNLERLVVPLFESKRLEQAPQRAGEFLVELLLVDVASEHFTGVDLGEMDIAYGADGACLTYAMKAERKNAYADWSQALLHRHAAYVVDGLVLLAPQFEGRIPGKGSIHGDLTGLEVGGMRDGIKAAIAHPWVKATRAGAAQTDDQDALTAVAHLALLDAAEEKVRRQSAIALREFVDHPAWTVPRLAQCLALEKDAGVLMDLIVTVGLLEAEGKPMLSRLAELEQHDDKQLAQLAHKTRQRIEQAVQKR
jgi:hypothetical protein